MMKFIRLFLIALIFCSAQLSAQVNTENMQVKSSYTGSWTTRKAKLVELIQNYENRQDGWDDFTRYGTYKYLKTDSTGFFYVKKIDGRWWMVDPDGYAGINMAVTSFSSSNIQADYDLTKRLGFNGTGNFLASESQTKSGYNVQNHAKFSFTRRLNFFLNYKNDRKKYYTTPTSIQGSLNHVVVLDPEFEAYCDRLASTYVTPFVDERDLLGWFTDNEINFNQDQLRNLVRDLPVGDPSRDATLAWAATKGLTEQDCANYTAKVTEELKQEFASYLAEHYFAIVSQAIRKYDTNHLILGSRLHGRPRAISGVVKASHQYMDVSSVNFYDRWSPNEQIADPSWTDGHPCLIGEFYIKDINVQSGSQSGAGWYVNSQADRGRYYQNSCIEFLENKDFIGWHYFRFKDDDDGSNKGIVNNALVEYVDMTKYMEELNKQVYSIIDHLDGVNRRPNAEISSVSIKAIQDTYVIPGISNHDNFGAAELLEVQHHATEANRREAFFKFDLTAIMPLLSRVKNATLELNCAESDRVNNRHLIIAGIEDNSWNESTFTGAIRQENKDWRLGYNRLSSLDGKIKTGLMQFDVTNWMYYLPTSEQVSFKLFDIITTDRPVKIVSSEATDVDLQPKLILNFWEDISNVTSINGMQSEVFFSPNPAKNYIQFTRDNIEKTELWSINGKLLTTTGGKIMDLTMLPTGFYLLRLYDLDGNILVNKLQVLK